MINFYLLSFSSTMILGTLISVSAMSWLIAWMGLELNLLSIIPLMKTNKLDKFSSESTIKYFLTQALASMILLFSMVILSNKTMMKMDTNMITLIPASGALLLKMGAAPLHFWLPEVVSGMNWKMNLVILTWQKIAPMILFSLLTHWTTMTLFIIILSSMIGGIQGSNQTCLRKILAYSSINHIGWMIAAISDSMTLWLLYFTIYFTTSMIIMIFLEKSNSMFVNQIQKMMLNKKTKLLFMMNFLSLGGLPPFLGFLPKWMIINSLTLNEMYLTTIILIIFTLLSLFIYTRLMFPSMALYSSNSLNKQKMNSLFWGFSLNILSTMGLFLSSMSYLN
uniref:NADH-ubiquinone oxidoreductase chain 2 n=1 Tax=Phloeosinus perlatus TaxID=2800998 RepID=A0A891GTK6_9CUCU|nr:NADH dehydrogenase subunit 2 [Phloeosinus perlatus]QRK25836.1 NADH dehydrogenase subunit 2 [Phloeosinus perlatus]